MLDSILSTHIQNLYGDIWFAPVLSAPPKAEHGEYCFGVFTLAKPLGKSPNMIATEIANILRNDIEHFTQVNVIWGYVNFSCTTKVWMNIFNSIAYLEMVKPWKWETIVVDYIGANAGKPLHIGHICTPSIGQAICNIYTHLGYNVIGDSHFGDWGGIFGKLIWSWKYQDLKSIIKSPRLEINSWEITDPCLSENSREYSREYIMNYLLDKFWIKLLYVLYLQFHINLITQIGDESNEAEVDLNTQKKEDIARKEFKKITEWDKKNIQLWKKFTAISITEIEKKLDILNVHATYNIGESFYEWLNLPRPKNEDYPLLNGEKNDKKCTMKDIVRELIEKRIAIDNSIVSNWEDKSIWVSFPEEKKLPSCILQKKDGTGLYLTSDLAAIKYRLTNGWNPTKIIYSVDVRQQLHLRQAFWIAKQAWPELTEWVEFFHAFNGFIKLKEGAMSTRHGTVIFLEDLITEGKLRTEAVLAEKWKIFPDNTKEEKNKKEAIINAISISAIKYSYLSQDREKDVTFDWDKALSFEGNSGPYIQYACVRAAKVANSGWALTSLRNTQELILSPYDTALIRTLGEMEDKILDTANKYKPHILALFCYDLAVCFNSFYVHTPKILDESDENLKHLRLELCDLVAKKLTLGFDLLGMKMPSEM